MKYIPLFADFYNFNENIYSAIFVGQNNLILEFYVVWSNTRTHSSLKLHSLLFLILGGSREEHKDINKELVKT